MRYDNIIPFTYQRYARKIPSIYLRFTNKMTTNTLSVHVPRMCYVVFYFFPKLCFGVSKRILGKDMYVVSNLRSYLSYGSVRGFCVFCTLCKMHRHSFYCLECFSV